MLLTPVPHTLHTLLTPCPISLPYLILSHRTLQENQTALCVKVVRAYSGTIVTKPASRPSHVIDDIPRIPRKVSSLAGGGESRFNGVSSALASIVYTLPTPQTSISHKRQVANSLQDLRPVSCDRKGPRRPSPVLSQKVVLTSYRLLPMAVWKRHSWA